MSAISAGEALLLSLWTLWLLAALCLLPRPAGIALPIALAALGLVLILTGAMPWRTCLIGGLVVHVVAAGVTIVRQNQGSGQGPDQGQLRQALFASVSLGGLLWLLILRPTIPWLYPADIPIMIVTVAALVAAEYGGWVLFERTVQQRVASAVSAEQQEASRRLEKVTSGLAEEQRQRSAADEQNAQLKGTVQRLEETRAQQEAELGRRQASLSEQRDTLSQQQAELERLRAERDQALAALAGQPPEWYSPPAGDRSGPELGPAARAADVVMVRLTVDPRAVSRDGRPVQVTVERATFPIRAESDETPGHLRARAEGRLRKEIDGAVAQYSAQESGEPAWQVVSRRWVATGSPGLNTAAGAVIDFQDDLHHLILGEPVQELGAWVGLPGPVAGALGGIAQAAAIPGDRELSAVVRIIQIGGIVLGVMSGQPLLASACFKSLVHDELIHALEAVISKEFNSLGLTRAEAPPAPEPTGRAGPGDGPGPPDRPGPGDGPGPPHRPGPGDGPEPPAGPRPPHRPGPAPRPGPAERPSPARPRPAARPGVPPPGIRITPPGRGRPEPPGRPPGISPF